MLPGEFVNVRDRLRRYLLLGIEPDHRVQDYFTEPAIASLDLAQHPKCAVHVAETAFIVSVKARPPRCYAFDLTNRNFETSRSGDSTAWCEHYV